MVKRYPPLFTDIAKLAIKTDKIVDPAKITILDKIVETANPTKARWATRFVDLGAPAKGVVEVTEKVLSKNRSIFDILQIVENKGSGRVHWLEVGFQDAQNINHGWGWIHIKTKHLSEIIGHFGSKTEGEVQEMIRLTVNQGELVEETSTSTVYMKKFLDKNNVLQEFRVVVSNRVDEFGAGDGAIITAFVREVN